MRTQLKAVLFLGLGTMQILATTPEILAADLAVTPSRRATVTYHRAARVVLDYDGTAIALRRARPIVVRDYAGVPIVYSHLYVAQPLERAEPTRYLNGEPVWPIETPRRRWWR
jgi:hypothetical protein